MLKHDIRDDAVALRNYIGARVQTFDSATNDGPGVADSPVSLIHFGFEHEQAGYVAIVFDTRPDATPDGEWTMHLEAEKNWLEFPRWAELTEAVFRGETLELTDVEGEMLRFGPDSDEGYVEVFGQMIAHEVAAAIAAETFAKLPRTQDCKVYVEQINGAYDWPEEEEPVSVSKNESNDSSSGI